MTMKTNIDRFRMTREEREFVELSKHLDIEVFSIELEQSLAEGVRAALSRRQAEFDRFLEAHAKTVAERERWNQNWGEYRRRMAKFVAEKQVIPAQQAALQLAQRWGVKLVS